MRLRIPTLTTTLILMSFFGFFNRAEGKKAPKIEPTSPHLAFVLLEEAQLPTPDALTAAYKDYSCDKGTISVEKGDDSEQQILTVTLPLGGIAFVALMDAPVPNNEAEPYYQYSLSSLSEPDATPEHVAHIMVTTFGTADEVSPLAAIDEFTSLLAAVAKSSPSSGIYWGNASVTHPTEFFLSIASECETMPRIVLWNGFSRGQENSDTMSFLSRGMNQIGLPELYLIFPNEDAGEAIGRFFDLLTYMADKGEAIPAGDTVGISESERIPVKYVKSPAGGKTAVWKVDLSKG